jgi:hypothetical protein
MDSTIVYMLHRQCTRMLRSAVQKDFFSAVETIYCEASFFPLMIHELIGYLVTKGLFLRGMFNQSTTAQFGLTQADLLSVGMGAGYFKSAPLFGGGIFAAK